MSVFNSVSLSYEYVKVRWQEPYVSNAVNRKFFGIFPKGIYSGFLITATGLRQVTVGPGSVSGGLGTGLAGPGYVSGNYDESIGYSIAVHQNLQGHSSTVNIVPGIDQNVNLDATGLDGQRVFAVLDVQYGISSQTAAQIKLVNGAEIGANPSFVVIGHIDVPVNPLTALDNSMVGYNDGAYPRLSPLSTPAKAGLMPASAWAKLDQFFKWEDLCYAQVDPFNYDFVQISPSQITSSGRRIYTYIQANVSSKFPRNISGNYNGGVSNDQLTKLNFKTGLISGAHGISGNLSFSIPSVDGTPSSFQTALVCLDPDDKISVIYGSVYASSALALADDNLPIAGKKLFQVCLVLISTDGTGAINPFATTDVFDRRPFLNLGGGDPVTTKGDLYTFDTASARLPVGADGLVLVADSAEPTGLKWAPASGGGGGALQWIEDLDAPLSVVENNRIFYIFNDGATEYLYASVRVPSGYIAGKQIKMHLSAFSSVSTNTILMQALATLNRTGTDAISSTVNQRTSTNAAIANVVDVPKDMVLDLTSSTGQINGVAVSARDTINIRLQRGTGSNSNPVKADVYSAEVTFNG